MPRAYLSLVELVRAINNPAATEAELRRCLDLDSFLITTAVLLFAGAFDQYTGWGPHNYYLHQNKDPFPPRRLTVPSDSSYSDIVASIEAFIRERYALARAQLDKPGQRPQFTPMEPPREHDGPKPGPPSADAPSDLRLVKTTASGVELRWTDHAEGEVASVVQKCLGPDRADFANVIGQGGANITTATDHDVQPGKTYRYRVYAVLPTPQGPRGTGVSNIITVQIPEK